MTIPDGACLRLGWRPINPKRLTYIKSANVSSTSEPLLYEVFLEAFGGFPIRLDDKSIGTLRGIRACGHEGIDELIEAIHVRGIVEVVAEW